MRRGIVQLLTLSLTVLGLGLVAAAAGRVPPARAAQAPATADLVRPATSVRAATALAGSPAGVLVSVLGWDGRNRLELLRPDQGTVEVTGTCDSAIGTARDVVLCDQGGTAERTVDLATGVTDTLVQPAGALLGWAGDGWYVARGSSSTGDAAIWFVPVAGVPSVLADGWTVRAQPRTTALADERGVLFTGAAEGQPASLYYLARDGAPPVRLAAPGPRLPAVAWLGTARIWWSTFGSDPADPADPAGTLTSAPRTADGTPGGERSVRDAVVSGRGAAVGDELVLGWADRVTHYPADPEQPRVDDLSRQVDQSSAGPGVVAAGGAAVAASHLRAGDEVYRVDAPAPDRYASLLPTLARPTSLSLDGARLSALWSGAGAGPTRGDLVAYTLPAEPAGVDPEVQLADTDARRLLTSGGYRLLVDGQGDSGALLAPSGRQTSVTGLTATGTTLSYGVLTTPSQVLLPTGRSVALPAKVVGATAFGSRVAWTTGDRDVWVRDVATSTVATRLTGAGPLCPVATGCTVPMALWGDSLVLRAGDGTLVAWDLTHRTSRPVVGCEPTCPGAFAVDRDVLVWVDRSTAELRSLDLTQGSAGPTVLAQAVSGSVTSLAMSEGRLAWVQDDVAGPRIRWTSVPPAGVRPAGRLLYALASGPGLSPDGDHAFDTWSLDSHDAAPGGRLTLTLRLGSTVVRTLTSTAPGDVRFTWDGRSTSGAVAADGVYSWSLTGVDGDGRALAGPGGSSSFTGTVVLRTQAPPGLVKAPSVSASVTAIAGRTIGWWGPAVSVPPTSTGYTLRYQRRVREVDVDTRGRPVYSPWVYVTDSTGGTVTTARTGAVSTRAAGHLGSYSVQQSVRVLDSLGNVGAWSPVATSVVPLDDSWRFLQRRGRWTTVYSAWSFNGRHQYSSAAGASATAQGWARTISVVGARCGGCGTLRVDLWRGSSHQVVNLTAYASRWEPRYVWRFTVPYGEYTATVINTGTGSRRLAVIDAFGFGL